MFNNTKAYKVKNITRGNGTDSSMDSKLHLLENLIHNCFNNSITHSYVLPEQEDGKYLVPGMLPGAATLAASVLVDGPMCPRNFDGFACWDETPPAKLVYQSCPDFVVGFDPRRFVFKRCTENGTWYVHPEAMKPWTNYTTCVDVEDLDFRSVVNDIYVYGYSFSVAALFISIAIFLYLRNIFCARIRIHLHLFTAFAINNILWIIWYKTVVNNVQVLQDNKVWCQVLHVLTNYSMVTSYFWMFCEGLHLHIALVVVFIKEDVTLRCFVVLGWGVSMVVVAAYAVTRYMLGENERCWMDQSNSFWIIVTPVVCSLLLSLVFLINVVWVLVRKLNPTPNYRGTIAVRKATRAALILIPLFGLHFILIPLRPAPDSPSEKVYQVVSALLTSLQGLCVSILFCFTNHEVRTAASNHVCRFFGNNEGLPMTGVTAGESVANTRDNVV